MDIKINNAEQVKNMLLGLSNTLKNKILKNALQLIAKPILQSAESKVWSHQRTGRLYRSLGQKAIKAGEGIIIKLGANKTGKFRGSHAHFLENGTIQRSYITKKGVLHKTGRVSGINYWSSSIEENSGKSESEFATYIIQSFEKEVDSLVRKSNKL